MASNVFDKMPKKGLDLVEHYDFWISNQGGFGSVDADVIRRAYQAQSMLSRVIAKGEEGDCYLELDVHTELYPMLPGKKFRMLISATLNMDGSAVSEGKQKSLADKFEYVVHGLLYKMAEAKEKTINGDDEVKVVVNISFGGLRLMLKGDPLKMHAFKSDQKLFLLLRRI